MSRKTVLVTGSTRGIGRAIALKFASNDYNIIINCVKSETLLHELVSEIKNYNPNVLGILADVSIYEEVTKMFKKSEEVFGTVDILVNNAGVSSYGLFNAQSILEINRTLNINLGSVINCTHHAVQKMVANKSGVIVNISSIWGNVGASCEAVYSASKGAINSFSMALAKELAPCNIRVNAVACGVIDTDMNNIFSEKEKAALCDEIPLGRLGNATDVANLVYFLCSADASYLTGKVITLDGGLL